MRFLGRSLRRKYIGKFRSLKGSYSNTYITTKVIASELRRYPAIIGKETADFFNGKYK